MQHFKFYNKQDILSLTKLRKYETKLGERMQVLNQSVTPEESFASCSAKFVLFGIPEDIGIRANGGIGGSDDARLVRAVLGLGRVVGEQAVADRMADPLGVLLIGLRGRVEVARRRPLRATARRSGCSVARRSGQHA